ncbi:hypothetical protein JHK84_055299 [Glycine max]|nr:hypothetical protein JHK84_055299 [Glycine max]
MEVGKEVLEAAPPEPTPAQVEPVPADPQSPVVNPPSSPELEVVPPSPPLIIISDSPSGEATAPPESPAGEAVDLSDSLAGEVVALSNSHDLSKHHSEYLKMKYFSTSQKKTEAREVKRNQSSLVGDEFSDEDEEEGIVVALGGGSGRYVLHSCNFKD